MQCQNCQLAGNLQQFEDKVLAIVQKCFEMNYDVLTVKEVSEIMRISLPATYGLFQRKDFPGIRCGERNNYRISREAFNKWFAGQSVK